MSTKWDEWQEREWERRDLTRWRFHEQRDRRRQDRRQARAERRSQRRHRLRDWGLGLLAVAPLAWWYIRAW